MWAKKSIKNVISSLFGQIITILLGVYIPHLIILNLGSESNGLVSSVNTVISYLNLLEAGIGTASLQALYGPVAKNDRDGVNGILSATNQLYKRTGLYYLIGLLGISLIFPVIAKSQIPLSTVIIVILLSGMPQVISFCYQGKYKIFLQSDGKNYILTNIQTATSIITSVGKILILNLGMGLIALQAMYFAACLLQALVIELYIRKKYGWMNLKVKANKAALNQRSSVLVHQISGLIFNSTDTVILTLICGLSVVSIYTVYTMIFGMVGTLIQNVTGSVGFYMGQTFNVDRKKYLILHDVYEVGTMALTFALYLVLIILAGPFIAIYTAGAEISYVDKLLPYLFAFIPLLDNGRSACIKAVVYAGHFKQTRWHAVVEMVVNLSVSIVCAYLFGIYGVLFGTIAALLFRANAVILYSSKKILERPAWLTYRHWLINVVAFAAVFAVTKYIFAGIVMDSLLSLIVVGAALTVSVLAVFIAVNALFNRDVTTVCAAYLRSKLRSIRLKKKTN